MKDRMNLDRPELEAALAAAPSLLKLNVTGLFETGKVEGPAGPLSIGSNST